MLHMTPDEAKRHLDELIEAAMRGEQVVITHDDQRAVQLVPVSALVATAPSKRNRRSGTARGQVVISNDFDAPLPDFADYTP